MKLKGIYTALVTPFADEEIDFKALRRLLRIQVRSGIAGLVIAGTTGEAPALSEDEFTVLVKAVIDYVGPDMPVIVGTGTNNIDHTIHRTKIAKGLGAAAALVVTPYYNKPQQQAMVSYFTRITQETGMDVILYNVPSRTGVNLLPATVGILSGVPGIIGVKDASGDIKQVRDTVLASNGAFPVLSGDDGTSFPALCVGAQGVISVVSNILPVDMMDMFDAMQKGDTVHARGIDSRLVPMYQALFMETNPVPVKAALGLIGLCSNEVRMPLKNASDSTIQCLKPVMRVFELI